MPDARTIIIEALGPEVPASWRKQVADRMLTALRSAGFEVCAVAAPTITPQPTREQMFAAIEAVIEEYMTSIPAISSLHAMNKIRAVLDGVGGSITPADQEDTDA